MCTVVYLMFSSSQILVIERGTFVGFEPIHFKCRLSLFFVKEIHFFSLWLEKREISSGVNYFSVTIGCNKTRASTEK